MAVLARGTITVSVNNDLVYKGELSAPPANPEINWYYYNTTDGVTYVYDGENWAMMAQDGRSLLDQSNQYYLHDSKTTPPPDDAEWSDESIEPSSSGYVWIRTKLTWSAEPLITYTDARWSELDDLAKRQTTTEWINSFGSVVSSEGGFVGDMLAIKREDGTISTLLTNDDDEIPDIAVGIGDYDPDDVESLKAAAKKAPFAVFSDGLVRQASIQRKYITLTARNQGIYLADGRLLIDPKEGYNYIFSYQPTGGITVDLPELTNADSGTVVRIINMSGEPFNLTNGKIWRYNQAQMISLVATDVMAEYELEYIVKQDRSGALLFTGAWAIKRQVYESGWSE